MVMKCAGTGCNVHFCIEYLLLQTGTVEVVITQKVQQCYFCNSLVKTATHCDHIFKSVEG